MAPSAVFEAVLPEHLDGKKTSLETISGRKSVIPIRTTGVLDAAHKFEEVTPVIGREYPDTNIVDDLLNASNADELLRDLAVTSKSHASNHLPR